MCSPAVLHMGTNAANTPNELDGTYEEDEVDAAHGEDEVDVVRRRDPNPLRGMP